jgi:putative sporulation protein YtaF
LESGRRIRGTGSMNLLYMIFIALANNLDNISVRIAYSVRGIRISTFKNLWISFITFLIATLAAFSGTELSTIFSSKITSVISMLLLSGIGILIIREQFAKKDTVDGKEGKNKKGLFNILRKPEIADMDGSKEIDFKEATILGIALSLDIIGGGFSAGMMRLNIFLMGFLSALVSFLALWTGNYISAFLNRLGLGKKAAFLSGIVIIAIGLKQIL